MRAAAVVGLENVPLWHERDISHSSAERIVIPDAFLALDYMLDRFTWIVEGLVVYPERMRAEPLAPRTGSFFSHRLLLALVEAGLDRARGVPARAAQRDARVGRGARLPRARPRPTARSPRSLDAAALDDVFDLDATTSSTSTPSFDRLRRLVPKEEPVHV